MNSFVKSTDTSNRNGVIINDSPTYTRPFQDHATSKSRMSRNMFGENIVGGATCKRKSRHYSPLKVLFFALKSGLTGNCQLPHLITGEESENPADRFARLLDMPWRHKTPTRLSPGLSGWIESHLKWNHRTKGVSIASDRSQHSCGTMLSWLNALKQPFPSHLDLFENRAPLNPLIHHIILSTNSSDKPKDHLAGDTLTNIPLYRRKIST